MSLAERVLDHPVLLGVGSLVVLMFVLAVLFVGFDALLGAS